MSPVRANFSIGDRRIGRGQPCFVIAEAGVNHNGNLEAALALVDVAYRAGADAVKFQTFDAEALVSAEAPKAAYQLQATSADESQLEMLRALELPRDAYGVLAARCQSLGIQFMSTPFDEESADFLDTLGMPAFKISSGEITNLPFLEHVAGKKKPMLLSTGMATLEEVHAAVTATAAAGARDLAVLQCVSNYPADPKDVNLRAMLTMEETFGVPAGYSDHTLGPEVGLAAVALGAAIIEKHFTIDRTLPGPDHQASMEPGELAAFVRGIRAVEASLGDGRKAPAASEASTAAVARKSLVAAADIAAGQVLTAGDIAIKRPGTGLPPSERAAIAGRTARVAIPRGALITREMLA